MEEPKYFIGKTEYTGFEILKFAFDMEWRGAETDVRLKPSVLESIKKAIVFLDSKGVRIITVYKADGEEMDSEGFYKAFKDPPKEKPVDDSIMICLMEDSIYEVNTTYLGIECWDLQIFGVLGCKACAFKNKEGCSGGEAALEEGVNSLGHKIPIAKEVGKRPKRDNAAIREEL